jgi:hypothetical protein
MAKYSSARRGMFNPLHPEKWVGADKIVINNKEVRVNCLEQLTQQIGM